MPDSSNRGEPSPVTPERRRRAREYAKSLVYVELGANNGGIALNFSEHGIAVQAANEVTDEVISQIRFQLPHSLLWIETAGRVVWTSDSRTLAAIEFTGLSQKSLDQIRQWLEYESKVDIGAMQSAPKSAPGKIAKPIPPERKADLPAEAPRPIPKLSSALAQMLAKDPSYAKMEEQLRDSSDIPSFEELARRDAERQAQRAAKQELPPEPVAEISLGPEKPAPDVILPPPPAPPTIEPPVMAPPPASLPADFERTKIYEPPPRTRVRHASAESQAAKPAKPREPVQDIPIDPESVEAQEEIRKIIASGEEARSRTILYRLQKAPLSIISDAPLDEIKSAAPAPKTNSSLERQKNSSLNQKSALSRPAVRIASQGPDAPARTERRNWTLPILLGILVILLAILVWLGIRDSGGGSALAPRSAHPSKAVARDAVASLAVKDPQIEVVDAKGRRRMIPSSAPAQTPSSTTAAEPKPLAQ